MNPPKPTNKLYTNMESNIASSIGLNHILKKYNVKRVSNTVKLPIKRMKNDGALLIKKTDNVQSELCNVYNFEDEDFNKEPVNIKSPQGKIIKNRRGEVFKMPRSRGKSKKDDYFNEKNTELTRQNKFLQEENKILLEELNIYRNYFCNSIKDAQYSYLKESVI